MSTPPLHLLSVQIRREHDIVGARRRARQIAALLGFDAPEQTRIATATSELARNAFQYAGGGAVDYFVEGETAPQVLSIRVSDRGPGIRNVDAILSGQYRSETGMGLGIVGTRRLMDAFDLKSGPEGTIVSVKKMFPRRAPVVKPQALDQLIRRLSAEPPSGPIEEVQQQNQELLQTLEQLRQRQEDLERVNRELEDTNRGVVALYAELDERADHLRRADELKTRFLSNMTHEFRTPVNSILALTSLLADRLGAVPDQKDELFYIRRSAQQLSEIVDDLLDIAKVEAGKIDVHPTVFEIGALFGALRGMLRPLLINQSLSLVFEEPEGIPAIYSDESKLSQILRNFISNALKYTEQGEVRVSAAMTRDRRGVIFTVADTGIGIPESDIQRVFEEFVQIENPLQRRVKGTGLGLPLSKRLAELLGGSVGVTSQFGLGSTFTVTIPLAYRIGSQQPEPVLLPGRSPVLILEDADEDLLMYDRVLANTRFQPVPCRTIAAATAALEAFKPAAIVLDLRLQGEDSWSFMTKLKRGEQTASIPLIIVSTVDDRQKGLALGASAYCVKPITAGWLVQTLEELVPRLSEVRVLAVDDEEAYQFILRGLLNDSRYQVMQAGSGRDGLRLSHEVSPDVILLDFRLTDITGLEVWDRLLKDAKTSAIPVIFVTSQSLPAEELARFDRAPIVLSKATLTRDALQTAIRQAITQSSGTGRA